MQGTVGPNPYPMTPDEGHGVRGDLRAATDRRQRALGYGGAAVDKWLCEWPFADGRAAVYERWRHARLHTPERDVFPAIGLGRSVPSLERKDRRAQEDAQAEEAYKSSSNSLFDVHRNSFEVVHHQELVEHRLPDHQWLWQ
jgi:hypothetical protein